MRNRLVFVWLLAAGCGSADVSIRDGGDGAGGPDGPLPDAPTMVTFRSYDHAAPTNLPFFAFQEGDDPWEAVAGVGGEYTFMVPGGRYGIAWVCPEADTNFVRGWVLYATTRDVWDASLYCHLTGPSATMTGMISGLSSGEMAQLAIGEEYAFANASMPSYSVMVVPGQGDIAARREGGSAGLSQVLLEHDVTLGNTSHNLDFQQGVAPVISTIVATGKTAAESISYSTYLRTNLGASQYLFVSGDQWAGVPATALRGNDVHEVSTTAFDSTAMTSRWVDSFVREPADLAVTLPDLPPAPSVEVVPGSYVRLAVTVERSDAQLYRFLFRYYPSTSLFWTLDATAGWLDAAGRDRFEMPDLTNLSGWQTGWGFTPDMQQGWELGAWSGNRSVFDLWDSQRFQGPAGAGFDGLERKGTRYSGTLTP